MKDPPRKQDKILKEALETMNEAEASYGVRIWIGAIFFYLLKRGKVPFEKFQDKKYEKRNVVTGYFLVLIIVGLGILLTWKLIG